MKDNASLYPANLETIFYPRSVAIVGTNRITGTVPHDILVNILKSDFQGIVYPVSPRDPFISGIKTTKYVIDIKDPVDLAIIVFPSSVCDLALEQCGQKGIKSVIVISAGFREIGGMGIEREEKLKKIASKYDISFIGPNCLGVINTDPRTQLNASFARQMPEAGNIGFLSQSGALCTAVLDYAQAKHIGFSKFISFGNKADIDEVDLLYYLGQDPKTRVILLYLEEIGHGRKLMQAAHHIIEKTQKPILAIKAGRTQEGASAAASHTGSLAGSDDICDAAFKQAGIIRCSTIEEMFNKAIVFAYQSLPKNNRIAIVTNAGGPGVLTTDAAIEQGLKLGKFSETTTQMFRKALPKTANINNPVDVIGDARADRYNIAVSQTLKDKNIDGVFVILTPQSMTDIDTIAREVCNVAAKYTKPLYTSFMGEAHVQSGIDILQRNNIPHYILPESMCKAFSTAFQFKNQLEIPKDEIQSFSDIKQAHAKAILETAQQKNNTFLPEPIANAVLDAYGLPVVKGELALSKDKAIDIAQKIGYPVALKVVSEHIIHKFDVKGVELNLQSEKDVKQAWQRIHANVKKHKSDAKIDGLYVMKMIPPGEQVILGIKKDVSFGPVLMFGLGGIFVEIYKDITFRVAPVGVNAALSMVREIKGYSVLGGARETQVRDINCICTCLQRLSKLAMDQPAIKELDINPLLVLNKGQGCYVADAKIMLENPRSST